ncbi:hypothetical protein [Streptomyces sp. RKAG293]|uniref:protein kinase domain-containing protein n=1 Tax=Streptomyces sp. RKAG293 TaxID=2893403 RepID=UPI002034868D|nr:hypothetical protein [Streptomyces sp. RKAG293]MCM2422619.1 hypothetical protein [Streptomyces sp. RKAG293]
MTWISTPDGRRLRLGTLVGSGSSGLVYPVEEQPGLVAKLVPCCGDQVHYRRRIERLVRRRQEPRTALLLGRPPNRFSWPLALVTTDRGVPGYVMRDMRVHYRPMDQLLRPAARSESLPEATWATGLAAAASLAGLLADLHRCGYVVGDLKPDNLWVDERGAVGLSDVDSLQFTDRGELFRCEARTPGYTAPEGLAAVQPGPPSSPPTPRSDCFVLAVLVHQLLCNGLHPFHGYPADQERYVSLDDNLRHRRCRLLDPASLLLSSRTPPLDVLPRATAALMRCAFADTGRGGSAGRPDAAAWARHLREQAAPERIRVCPSFDNHLFTVERPWCPWCDLDQRRGVGYPAPRPTPEPNGSRVL